MLSLQLVTLRLNFVTGHQIEQTNLLTFLLYMDYKLCGSDNALIRDFQDQSTGTGHLAKILQDNNDFK